MIDVLAITEPPIVDYIYAHVPPYLADTQKWAQLAEWQAVSPAEQAALFALLSQHEQSPLVLSGEQLTNTLYNCHMLGGGQLNTALLTYFAQDKDGKRFAQELVQQGIEIQYAQFSETPTDYTGSCISLQLPSGEKKMLTCLSNLLTLKNTPPSTLEYLCRQTRYVLIEGYLFFSEPQKAKEIIETANWLRQSENLPLKIGITLSSEKAAAALSVPWVIAHVDLVAGNQEEFAAFCGHRTFAPIAETFNTTTPKTLVYTMGKSGAYLQHQNQHYFADADPLPANRVLDVTGAGDGFLAGILYGILKGIPLPQTAALAHQTARLIVQQQGARLDLASRASLLPNI